MRIYEKDYRYLLLHLLPAHRLPPALRRRVARALDSGNTADLRRESVRALEALCETDYLERDSVRAENGDVVVGYHKPGGRFRLSVAVPGAEWSELTGAAATPGPAPSGERPPDPRPDAQAGVVSRADYRHVSDIIRSFAVTDRSEPLLSRLESLLDTLRAYVDAVDVRLFLLEDVVAGQDTRGERVEVIGEADLRAVDVLRSAVEAGAKHLHARDELDIRNWGGAAAQWSVLGAAPVFSMGKVHGALCVLFPPGLGRDVMMSRLELAAETARRAVEYHNQIENMTSVDALTGIYNRHFYDDQMPVEIERAMRSGSVLSMLVIDIDDFKRINDELGHKKGDEALAAIASLIKRNLRKVDLPFRYGGEEIVILLPGTSQLESVHTAERLRRVIAEYDGFLDHHGHPRRLSVSVGVSVYPDTARTADELFTQADSAMYEAKQHGKNRVVLFRNGGETKPAE